ncbi:hypothetical protein ACPPVT_12865 [Angustibacter sp. McL0619]|uniref:hypothetical protein n=1 Tax=Angustibacter sp. McL0619 TaxID=3415676 RepID=UPI003CF4E155
MPADRDLPSGDAGRDADLDAAFAQIVAGWDDAPEAGVPPWPASEDATSTEAEDEATDTPSPPPASSMEQIRYVRDHGLPTPDDDPQPVEPSPLSGPRDWELAAEHEGHFEPPDPPFSARVDTIGQLAWAGVVLGPAFLLFAGLFWRDVGRLWLAIAAAAFVGGFVALVLRLPQSRDEDGDDGAVV